MLQRLPVPGPEAGVARGPLELLEQVRRDDRVEHHYRKTPERDKLKDLWLPRAVSFRERLKCGLKTNGTLF
jgi:hypothetical protein